MKTCYLIVLFSLGNAACFAQASYQEVPARNGGVDLVGHISPEQITNPPFGEWYKVFYEYHEPDKTLIEEFKGDLKKYNVLVFMGTWCSDSQREIPAFIKLLDEAEFPLDQLKIVGVHDKGEFYKTSPNGEEWGLQIKMVPTIIFLKDGKEVNRIVESPLESLEKDIKQIISGQEYVPNYADLMKSK
ncbi:MAG: TlpA family protein disulfide reductase [Flavobacteriaceae bacterium]